MELGRGHLFFVHAALQVAMVNAIVKREVIDWSDCLIVCLRATYQEDLFPGAIVVDGERYRATYRLDFLNFNFGDENGLSRMLFRMEVVDRLVPGYRVYSAAFDRWFQQEVARKAGAVYVLEDGTGSLLAWDGLAGVKIDGRGRLDRLKYNLKVRLGHRFRVAYSVGYARKLLRGAAGYYHVSPLAFPSAPAARRYRLEGVFPPLEPGRYDGKLIWAPSAMVEQNLMPLEPYLRVLEKIVALLVEKGVGEVYVKFHPDQVRHEENLARYREILESSPRLTVSYLPQGHSVERLAYGSDLTLLAGISSLMMYVNSAGRGVYTYDYLLAEAHPPVRALFAAYPPGFVEKLSRPLSQMPPAS